MDTHEKNIAVAASVDQFLPAGENTDTLRAVLDVLEEALERLPGSRAKQVKRDLHLLREIIMEARPPKLMFVGRRGAGKSSLVNAMCGQRVAEVGAVLSATGSPTWYEVHNELGKLRILDTRGLGDLTRPESANFKDALTEIKAAVDEDYPDAILFLCRAKDVDSRIGEDLANLVEIREHLRRKHKYLAPVAGIVTQVDELDPKRVEPPFNHPQKQVHIRQSVEAIKHAFQEHRLDLMRVIPVSAYAEFEGDRMVYNTAWNVDQVVEYLVETLPKSAQLQLARLTKIQSVRRRMARTVAGITAAICGGIAATPIPLADIFPITAAQVGMISTIAYLGGRDLSPKAAGEFLVALGINVGAAVALRETARALAKLFAPGIGHAVSAVVASGGTWAIAEAAIAHFLEGASVEQARQRLESERTRRSLPSPSVDVEEELDGLEGEEE